MKKIFTALLLIMAGCGGKQIERQPISIFGQRPKVADVDPGTGEVIFYAPPEEAVRELLSEVRNVSQKYEEQIALLKKGILPPEGNKSEGKTPPPPLTKSEATPPELIGGAAARAAKPGDIIDYFSSKGFPPKGVSEKKEKQQ